MNSEFMIAPNEVRWNGKRMDNIHLYIKRYLFKNRVFHSCFYCDRWLTLTNASLEHLYRLSDGGNYSPSNLAIACRKCNAARGARSPNEYRKHLVKRRRVKSDRIIPYPIINLG